MQCICSICYSNRLEFCNTLSFDWRHLTVFNHQAYGFDLLSRKPFNHSFICSLSLLERQTYVTIQWSAALCKKKKTKKKSRLFLLKFNDTLDVDDDIFDVIISCKNSHFSTVEVFLTLIVIVFSCVVFTNHGTSVEDRICRIILFRLSWKTIQFQLSTTSDTENSYTWKDHNLKLKGKFCYGPIYIYVGFKVFAELMAHTWIVWNTALRTHALWK